MTTMNKTISKGLGALFLAVLATLPLTSRAGDEFEHSRKLTLDTTSTGADVKEAVSQLPMLVRLHSGNFVFTEAKPDGSDIRFFATDGKTPLKYHFERYDSTNELAVAWVQMPKLAPNAKTDVIVVKWGNAAANKADDVKGSFDATQVFMLNFSEVGAPKDSTGQANHPKESSGRAVAAGPIGGAVAFDGNGKIVLPASPSLKVTASGGWTFSAWVKPLASDSGTLMTLGSGAQGVNVSLTSGVPSVMAGGATAQASAALKPGVWQNLAVVISGGKAQFFINGAPSGEAPFAAGDAAGDATIGQGFKGEMDAVGLSGTARSASYIKAMASNEMADSPMMAFADEGGGDEGEGISYFKILIGAVTIDGWV
jgi:biopolymer transport protein ExbB